MNDWDKPTYVHFVDSAEYDSIRTAISAAEQCEREMAMVEQYFEAQNEARQDHHAVDWEREKIFGDARKTLSEVLYLGYKMGGLVRKLKHETERLVCKYDDNFVEKMGDTK